MAAWASAEADTSQAEEVWLLEGEDRGACHVRVSTSTTLRYVHPRQNCSHSTSPHDACSDVVLGSTLVRLGGGRLEPPCADLGTSTLKAGQAPAFDNTH